MFRHAKIRFRSSAALLPASRQPCCRGAQPLRAQRHITGRRLQIAGHASAPDSGAARCTFNCEFPAAFPATSLSETVVRSKARVTCCQQRRKRFTIRNTKRLPDFPAAIAQKALQPLRARKNCTDCHFGLPSPPQIACDKLVPKFRIGFGSAVASATWVEPRRLRQERES